jgi:hypothetical protein
MKFKSVNGVVNDCSINPLNLAGPRWGRYYVGPIQFMVCYGAVVACTLLGGQCMKVKIFLLLRLSASLTLWAEIGGIMNRIFSISNENNSFI